MYLQLCRPSQSKAAVIADVHIKTCRLRVSVKDFALSAMITRSRQNIAELDHGHHSRSCQPGKTQLSVILSVG